MELMRDDTEGAIRSVRLRQAFNERLDRAIDAAQASLRPLFDAEDGGGVDRLSRSEAELMHEIMFKLAILRSVILYRDVAAQEVHERWLDAQTIRRRARSKRRDASPASSRNATARFWAWVGHMK